MCMYMRVHTYGRSVLVPLDSRTRPTHAPLIPPLTYSHTRPTHTKPQNSGDGAHRHVAGGAGAASFAAPEARGGKAQAFVGGADQPRRGGISFLCFIIYVMYGHTYVHTFVTHRSHIWIHTNSHPPFPI